MLYATPDDDFSQKGQPIRAGPFDFLIDFTGLYRELIPTYPK